MVEDLTGRPSFDQLPRIHDGDAFAKFGHNAEIMGYEQNRRLQFAGALLQKGEDLALRSNVECGSWLVCDNDLRMADESAGDHQTLTLAPAEFVRKTAERSLRIGDL